ncbi:MAG: serine/threonine protein phosphatase PrpC [Myxococcota bacterium]
MMLDEAAPLTNKRLLEVAQRLVGALAAMHRRGVELESLTRANLLISPDHSVRMFDLDVAAVHDVPVPAERAVSVLQSLGELLRRYCDVEAGELADYLASIEAGEVTELVPVGRAVEARYPTWSALRYAPKLGGMSDVGLTRQLNEDNWGWVKLSERASLYVVADGMGGHDGGEVASEMAVKTLCEHARKLETSKPEGEEALEALIRDAFQMANNTVKDAADDKGTDMGTTLVAILVVDEQLGFLANVGDSRGYLLRDGRLHQLSIDHSLVQKMVDRGRITADQARNHPHSNILLRTVGTEHDVDIDVFRVQLEAGDKVLMCSDGLWGEVEDRDIESILNTYGDPRIAARELVRAAHHGGGKDNVTLMIVGV